MATLAPVVLVLLPLLILPGILFYWDVTPKAAVLLFGTATALFFFRENLRALRALLATRAGRWFAALLACQLVSLTVSTVLSTAPALSFGGTNWRRYGLITQAAIAVFALILAGHFALSAVVRTRALRATALAGCAAAVYGIVQYFGWDPLLTPASYRTGEGEFAIVRPPGTFGHAAYFSTYLLYGLFAALAVRGQHPRLAHFAAMTVPAAILLSGTRAAVLGLLAGLAVLIVLVKPRLRTVVIAGALVLAALVALLATPSGERLRARLRWSIEDARGGARLLLWRDSIRMAGSRWIAGTGPETFGNAFPPWQSRELARQYPDFSHESPHNLFLDALNAQGVPGLFVWLGLCSLPLFLTRRHPVLGAGCVAAIVSMQFTSPTIATALGLLVLISAMLEPEQAAAESASTWPARVVAVLAAVGFAVAGCRLIVSDARLQAMKSAFDAGRPDQAAQAYQQASRWAMPGGNVGIYYSRRMAAAGRRPEALEAARQAAEGAEDQQNAYYNLAVIQASLDDAQGVEASLRRAIGVAPNWFKPHWTLAQILSLQGRVDEAEREAELAADLAGGRFPEVTQTLSKIRLARGQTSAK